MLDRNTVLAIVLSTLILLVWMVWFSPPPPERVPPGSGADSLQTTEQSEAPVEEELPEPENESLSLAPTDTAAPDSMIAAALEGEARNVIVESPFYKATFSTKGGTLTSFQMKKYTNFDQVTPVEMVSATESGAVGLEFMTPWNRPVDTRALYFKVEGRGATTDSIKVERDNTQLILTRPLGQGTLRYIYSFDTETYEIGLVVEMESPDSFVSAQGYDMIWYGGIPFTEDNIQQEAEGAGSHARHGGDIVTLDAAAENPEILSGSVDWVAVKNRFFAAVVFPEEPSRSAELQGMMIGETGQPGYWEDYQVRLEMTRPEADHKFRMYLGPMELQRLDRYNMDLYGMVDFGWFGSISSFIAHYIIVPTFSFMSRFIPNFGLIILLFAVLLKIVLYPLTKTSYKSMAKMRQLQPKMAEIKEKYKDNPQKQQEATMKLYREGGANPLGGCLPMLLQFPILIAMWRFFPNSIEIRQKGFLWATDLSAPDIILDLPFEIPFYGAFVSGFTLLMGLSMVVQMQVQSGGDVSGNPAMKYMKYIMPIFIVVLFNTWAAGLNLYYLAYNVLSAIQQRYINTHLENEGIIEKKGKGVKSKVPKTVSTGSGKKPSSPSRTRRK